MRVLQVLPHLNIGGITTYVYTLTKYLLKNGIEVAVCSFGGSQADKFSSLGIKTFSLPLKTKNELSPKVIISALKIIEIKKIFPYHLIHSHTRVTQVASQLAGWASKTPHIANFHGFYEKNKKRKIRKIIKAQGSHSIAITPFVRDDLINHFGADPQRVTAILSGIDLEVLNPGVSGLNLAGNPVIGSSGRLSPVKGFQYLVESIPMVLKKFPLAKFYLLGEGSYQSHLFDLAKKLNLNNCFSILKKQPLDKFLKSLDIFCLPSLQEPLGLSVLEAQYMGVPAIVSDVNGLNLLVSQNKTGLKINPGNSSALAQAIIELAKNKELRQSISQKAKKEVAANFNISQKIKQFIKLYEKVSQNIDN